MAQWGGHAQVPAAPPGMSPAQLWEEQAAPEQAVPGWRKRGDEKRRNAPRAGPDSMRARAAARPRQGLRREPDRRERTATVELDY